MCLMIWVVVFLCVSLCPSQLYILYEPLIFSHMPYLRYNPHTLNSGTAHELWKLTGRKTFGAYFRWGSQTLVLRSKTGPRWLQSCTVGHRSAKRCGSSCLFGSNFPEIYAHSQLAARASHGYVYTHASIHVCCSAMVSKALFDWWGGLSTPKRCQIAKIGTHPINSIVFLRSTRLEFTIIVFYIFMMPRKGDTSRNFPNTNLGDAICRV